MSIDDVRQAVQAIEAEGGTPSVRAVIAKIGGSSRDVQKFLRLLRDPDFAELRDVIEQAQQVQIDALIAEVEAREKPALEALLQEIRDREGPQIQALLDEVQRRERKWPVPTPGVKANPVPPQPSISLDIVRSLAARLKEKRDTLTAHRAAAQLATNNNQLRAQDIWQAVLDEAPLTDVEAAAVRQRITELSAGLVWRDTPSAKVANGVWQAHVLNGPVNPWVALPPDCIWERQRRAERHGIV